MADIPPDVSLPPSWYKVHFIAAAPEDLLPPSRIPPSQAIQVELITSQERLSQIERELKEYPNRAYALHMEKACIYESLGNDTDCQNEIRWCLSHWKEANPLFIMAFMRWAEIRDRNTQRALLMYMFHPESLNKLKGCPPSFVQEYLEWITNAQTISPEGARLVLEMAKSPKAITKALQILVKNGDIQAVEYVWEQLHAGRFSISDAAQVLAQVPDLKKGHWSGPPPSLATSIIGTPNL